MFIFYRNDSLSYINSPIDQMEMNQNQTSNFKFPCHFHCVLSGLCSNNFIEKWFSISLQHNSHAAMFFSSYFSAKWRNYAKLSMSCVFDLIEFLFLQTFMSNHVSLSVWFHYISFAKWFQLIKLISTLISSQGYTIFHDLEYLIYFSCAFDTFRAINDIS
jgi:hypothetical protein